MRFICLGCLDVEAWNALSSEEQNKRVEACMAYDDELLAGGHFVGGEALKDVSQAVTLRMKNGEVQVVDGPYAETKELLGGILILEARDLNHAIALMSKHPGVSMGPFEIRPANEEFMAMMAARGHAFFRQIQEKKLSDKSSSERLTHV